MLKFKSIGAWVCTIEIESLVACISDYGGYWLLLYESLEPESFRHGHTTMPLVAANIICNQYIQGFSHEIFK